MPDAFVTRALYTWKPDRLYRVYLASGQLYFIRIGGQGYGLSPALELQLGPLGALLSGPLQRRSDAKLQRAVQETDRIPPEIRVREHKHSFQIDTGSVAQTTILPPGRIAGHGVCVGRWNLSLRGGEEMKLQFEQPGEMQIALELLPRALGERLTIDVEWDPVAGLFVKPTSGRSLRS